MATVALRVRGGSDYRRNIRPRGTSLTGRVPGVQITQRQSISIERTLTPLQLIMIMTNLNFMALFFLSLFALTLTAPIRFESRDVFVPPVIYPHAGTVSSLVFNDGARSF